MSREVGYLFGCTEVVELEGRVVRCCQEGGLSM